MKLQHLFESQTFPEPYIIVLVGLPGSGKSFFRDKFLSDNDAVIVSSDDEIEKLAKDAGLDYTSGFKQFVGAATGIMKQNFRDAVNSDKNIIWDQTNLSAKKRKGILQQLPDHYYKVAVVFEVTDEELNKRLRNREKETGKSIPVDVVKNMAKTYQPPTKQEGFDLVKFM